MRLFNFIAAAAAITLSLNANAQLKGVGSNAEIAKIEKANAQVNAMQCPFTRVTKMAALTEKTKEAGTFYFQSPDNLSMKYDNGETFVITADNVSLTVGGKARTLRAGNRNVEDLAETLIACVKGKLTAIEGTLKSAKAQGKSIVVKIDTDMKVGRTQVSSLELNYDKTNMTLVSLNLVEKDGSFTLYELGTKTLNKSIDQSVFTHAKEKRGKQRGGKK